MKQLLGWMACLALALGGCGGGEVDTAPADDTAGGEHVEDGAAGEGQGRGGHPELSPELRAFHDVLSPVYHMDPGAERARASCEAADAMTALAGGVSEAMVTAVGGLTGSCSEAADVEATEAALESVHDAFHDAMEAQP
jgi:hypothetical protein